MYVLETGTIHKVRHLTRKLTRDHYNRMKKLSFVQERYKLEIRKIVVNMDLPEDVRPETALKAF